MQSSIIHCLFVTIGAALIAAVIVPSPAAATTVDEARRLCKANPKCKEISPGEFCVGTGTEYSCEHLVACDEGKACQVIYIKPGGGKKSLGSKGVAKFLAGGVSATPVKPATMPAPRLLDSRPDFSRQGPSVTGAPGSAPAAPRPGRIY